MHLAVSVRCSVVITEVQGSVKIVDVADGWVGEIPVVIGVQDGAVSRSIGTPETRYTVGVTEKQRATNRVQIGGWRVVCCNTP